MSRNSFSTTCFLYLPFVAINLGVMIFYSAINFLVLQKLPRFTESASTFLLPIAVTSLALIVFYRPIIGSVSKFRGEEFRAIVLVAILSIPAIVVLQTAIAQLSILRHAISKADRVLQTEGKHQFIVLDKIKLDTSKTGTYATTFRTYNKNAPDDIHFEVYRVVKIVSPVGGNSTLWYGMLYSEISKRDRSTQEQRYEKFKGLEVRSAQDFLELISAPEIMEVELNTQSNKYGNFEKAVQTSDSYDSRNVILTNIEERKPVSFKLKAACTVFIVCQIIWLLVCTFAKVSKHHMNYLIQGTTSQRKQILLKNLKESFEYIIPRKDYFLTPIILDLNILIFSLMYFGQADDASQTIAWGSNYSPLVWHGQIWRLFTAGFVHFDLPHLIGNMVALGFSGYMLEKVLGTKRFGLLYFISILGCSLVSLTFHDVVNAAGASGGVLGLLGAMLIYAVCDIGSQDNRIMFILVFMLFGFFTIIMGFIGPSNVDNAGHIGGLITGMITGLFFIPTVRNADDISL